MAVWFVSGHRGAVDWARRRGIDARVVRSLSPAELSAGDVVIGTLPLHLAAAATAAGCRVVALIMEVPETRRGDELSADEMDAFGARLLEVRVDVVGPFEIG